MSKKNKICIIISIVVGVIGVFVIKKYGSLIIRPSGHVIDEAFIKKCGACYGLITVLNSVFLGMVIMPLIYLIDIAGSKPDKTGRIIFYVLICILLLFPIYNAANTVKKDIECHEYVIKHKERKKVLSVNRGKSRLDLIIWIKGKTEHGSGFYTISSVYDSVEEGDDMYMVYSGSVLLNAFPVSEYECEMVDE